MSTTVLSTTVRASVVLSTTVLSTTVRVSEVQNGIGRRQALRRGLSGAPPRGSALLGCFGKLPAR